MATGGIYSRPTRTFALTDFHDVIYVYINMRKYSTPEVAKMLGIHQPNLQRAIREERISAPPLVKVGRLSIRLWSKTEIETARKELKKVKK